MLEESSEDPEGSLLINLLQPFAALVWFAAGVVLLAVVGNASPKDSGSHDTTQQPQSKRGSKQHYNSACSYLINFGCDVKRGCEVAVNSSKNMRPKMKPF